MQPTPHGPPLSRTAVTELQLKILDIFVEACHRAELVHFAYYGTLLGAVRHRGYIPWDDDIDIAMPREDYRRLGEIDWSALGLRLVDRASCQTFPFAFSKLCDPQTLVVEGTIDKYSGWGGVNIDLWPIDRLPRTATGRYLNELGVRILRLIVFAKILPARSGRAWWREASLAIAKALATPLSLPRSLQLLDSLILGHHGDLMGCRLGGRGAEQWFPASWFDEVVELTFEGRRLSAPRAHDAMLRSMYGDYLSLPPEDARVSHHSFIAYRLGG